jgi:hypothetical protein
MEIKAGQIPIEKIDIPSKGRCPLDELLAALQSLYCSEEYNMQTCGALVDKMIANKKYAARTGMNLWRIFVLAQVRLCLSLDYDSLHDFSNNHILLRRIIGAHMDYRFETMIFSYQHIYDNVSLLDNQTLKEINEMIVGFGDSEIFKQKRHGSIVLKK